MPLLAAVIDLSDPLLWKYDIAFIVLLVLTVLAWGFLYWLVAIRRGR